MYILHNINFPESVKIWSDQKVKMNFTEEDYWSVDSAITDQGWVFVFVKQMFVYICSTSKDLSMVSSLQHKSNLIHLHFQTQQKHVPNGWGFWADRCPVCLLAWGCASGKLDIFTE